MLNALRRMNDMDVRDPRQTLGYHGGSYRNLAREFFCLSPLAGRGMRSRIASPRLPFFTFREKLRRRRKVSSRFAGLSYC